MSRGFPCWECGEPAEGGVCAGPHESYSHSEALNRTMVMDLDRVRASVHPGRMFDEAEYRRRYYRENRERLLAQRRLDRRVSFEHELARALEETRRVIARGSSTAWTGVERLSAPFAPPAPGGGEPQFPNPSNPSPAGVADRRPTTGLPGR